MDHAGMVLAAGASRRMGTPKALLPAPPGGPLARHQAQWLEACGCDKVVIVLGSEANRISVKLDWPHLAVNEHWDRKGRFSSVQAGLRALPKYDGYVIIPVDTAGLQTETLTAVLTAAETENAHAVRPVYRGQTGYLVWISSATARRLLDMEADDRVRLDQILAPIETKIEIDDPALLHNPNTPGEWDAVRKTLGW